MTTELEKGHITYGITTQILVLYTVMDDAWRAPISYVKHVGGFILHFFELYLSQLELHTIMRGDLDELDRDDLKRTYTYSSAKYLGHNCRDEDSPLEMVAFEAFLVVRFSFGWTSNTKCLPCSTEPLRSIELVCHQA
jgi:hypothetical protein